MTARPPRQGATGAEIVAWARQYTGKPYAIRVDPEAARQLAAYTRAMEEAGAELGRQLAPIGQAIAAWGQAVSAGLTAAFAPLADLTQLAERGTRAPLGDPCGNPHPPFRPLPGNSQVTGRPYRPPGHSRPG